MTQTPNDPTMSGSPVETVAGGALSCAEIEALSLKAARGAGLSWGMAEEAGYAATWLEVRGLDGASTLLALLDLYGDGDLASLSPDVDDRIWRAKGAHLCPLAAGTALSDFRGLGQADIASGPLSITNVAHPLLLLPFVHALANATGTAVHLTSEGDTCSVDPTGAVWGDIAACSDRRDLTLSSEAVPQDPVTPSKTACIIDKDTLRRLQDYALRTTVPASDASRAGAGAATTDND
ncbi:DUF3726 domain-containing protein [Sedimentitalea todarodis]|uniref:DUF3726 domain-containing protein n=1 Tax=Sedimentitalea todarodis TaxID=1631240 RepID=A0ABU3VIG2_9RHOB|nr:DUF3726 domain-containing protein [Sedimentitalea todarodis]MDU9005959.1 DUF3726 domain-containing protein [Sedimentitalea todarodis]